MVLYLFVLFFLVKKWVFLFVLVKIVVDHENLLCLKSVVVYFDFVQIFEYFFQFCRFWSIYIIVIMICKIIFMRSLLFV